MLYRNYFCSEEERQEIDQKLQENEEKYQQQLREKYNPDRIFNNKIMNEKEKHNQPIQLIEYKERKWYHKIFEKIASILKKY